MGATAYILFFKYSFKDSLYSDKPITYSAKDLMYDSSTSLTSVPIEISAAYFTSFSISSGKIPSKSVVEVLAL